MDKIEEYISNQTKESQEILINIQKLVKEISPKAEEKLIYGVLGFKLNDKYLIGYAALKTHIGIYPEPAAIEYFKEELKSYETSKGAIKFFLDKKIPYNLIKKIVKYKVKLIQE